MGAPIVARKSKEWLYRKYVIEGLSQTQIATLLGCTHRAVGGRMKKLGIPVRSREHQRGPDVPHWKGGQYISHGQVYVLAKDHPHAHKNGYILRSRLVMEEHLGRFLKPEEVVHHVNGDTLDDRPENLMLFPDSSSHIRYHAFLRNKNPAQSFLLGSHAFT